MTGERQHLDRDDRPIRTIDLALYSIERLADAALARGKCEFPKIRVVPESTVGAGRRFHHGRRDAAVHGFEVIVERRRRVTAGRERGAMLDEAWQDQWFRCLDGALEFRRGLDGGDRYCGKLAQKSVPLAVGRTCNSGHYAVEFRHMLSRYPWCVGCSRTFPLMNSSVRRNSCLKRSGEIRSIAGGQPSGATPKPVKTACQLSGRKVSSSMGAICPRARKVAILCESGCGTARSRACCQNSPP